MKRALCILAFAACGGGDDPNNNLPDATLTDGSTGDAAPSCAVLVNFDPDPQFAIMGAKQRATAVVLNAPGVLTYSWQLRRDGFQHAFTVLPGPGNVIEYDASVAAVYEALVTVGGTTETCPVMPHTTNVEVPNANSTQLRLRIYPPPNIAAPPNEKLRLVSGGGNKSVGVLTVDPGVVVGGTTGAQAYLRLMPVASKEAFVEAFTNSSGAFSVRVLNEMHDVLVVPLVPGFAPRLVEDWIPGANLPVNAGTAITGTVLDPNGNAVIGAKVQMVIGGVPTTLDTTITGGAFTVRSSVTTGPATIEVTAPASSGLPRLVASSSGWSFGQSVQVQYATGIAIRDLAGAVVRRNSAPQANAAVTIVGTLAGGTITTGGTIVNATGEVRASATANGSGVLPTLRAPDELFDAAIVLPGEVTATTIDLRSAAPSTVNAPATVPITTQLRNSNGAPLSAAVLEARPKGVFAMAGIGTVRVVANDTGNATASLAPGVTYDLHLSDPQGFLPDRLAGPTVAENVTSGSAAAFYQLDKAIKVTGTVMLGGNPQPIGNAAVQILCATGARCVGAARAIPLANGASTAAGAFEVPIVDPGTM